MNIIPKNEETKTSRFLTPSLDVMNAFNQEPKEIDFVWDGFKARSVACLVAAGSTGKSFYALEIAMCVASFAANKNLLNLPINKHGKVLIISTEDEFDVLNSRIHFIGNHLDIPSKQQVNESLIIKDWYGLMPDIFDPECYDAIIQLCDGVRLLIIDTFSRFHVLSENDNGDMAKVISQLESIAKKTGTAILFLHHVAKGMAKDNRQLEQQASRGASAITDNVRYQLALQTMSEAEAKELLIPVPNRVFYVQASVSKQNYGKKPKDFWLKRQVGGVLLPDNELNDDGDTNSSKVNKPRGKSL